MSNLSRDVCVYNNGRFVEWLVAYPIRLVDGRTGVFYQGRAYPLRQGDVIDLEEPYAVERRRRQRDTAADQKSLFGEPMTPRLNAPLASPDDHPATIGDASVGVDELLPFVVLPPGEGVDGSAATLRKSGHYKDGEIDLRRLQVLADLERHFADRQFARYRSGFPSEEKNNSYIVLAIAAPNDCGEDAVAISPLKGEHATFLVRHGNAKSAWKTVLSRTKAEAVELGADRLIFKGRPEHGLDAYQAMLEKIIELLENAPNEPGDEALPVRSLDAASVPNSSRPGTTETEMPDWRTMENGSVGSHLDIATVADTPEQLERLLEDKPHYWVLAAFASELVQRRNSLQPLVEGHRGNFKTYTERHVGSVDELEALYENVLREMLRLVEKLDRDMRSAPFQTLFADRELYDDDPNPRTITDAASIVSDFYRANLLLARETRGVVAHDDYAGIIQDMAHLVDGPLEGVDQFITKLVGFIAALPTLQRHAGGRTEAHLLELEIDANDVLMKRIERQLRYQRQPWRRWFWPW